jgi:hypothetical protein
MRALAIAVVLAAAPAFADAPPEATALFDQGIRDLTDGKLDVACKELAASLARYPDSGTKGALAECDGRLGKVTSAWNLWRDLADTAPTPELRKDAAANAVALEPRLPHFVIHLAAATPGLVVTVNGAAIADPTLSVALPVDPGHLVIAASAPDRADWNGTFEVSEGKTTTIDIPALPPRGATATTGATRPSSAATGPSSDAPTASARHGRHVLGVTVLAAGAAVVIVGGVFGGLAGSQWNQAKADCGGAIDMCPPADLSRSQSEVNTAKSSALVSTVGLAVGGTAVVAGVLLYLTAPAAETSPTALRVVPSSHGLGLAIARSW